MRFLILNGGVISWRVIFIGLLSCIVQGCAKTQFGQELADSFNAQIESPQINLGSNKSESNKTFASTSNTTGVKTNPPIVSPTSIRQRQLESRTRLNPSTPQPYRITIQLSATDPSAPAEMVTEALRSAGVRFEVERIERVFVKP